MCGRFTLTTPARQLATHFAVAEPADLFPRYNVAPSQTVAVVGLKPDGTRRGLALLRWGLVPRWATALDAGPRTINVRAETVAGKFGTLLRERRCLIPADGFYEWQTVAGKKRPMRFTLANGGPFGFAGLWDTWGQGADRLLTCCLITTASNALVRPVHDRMPVILPPERYAEWLDPTTPIDSISTMLTDYPAGAMRAIAAGAAVNSPRNDGPECLSA